MDCIGDDRYDNTITNLKITFAESLSYRGREHRVSGPASGGAKCRSNLGLLNGGREIRPRYQ
jgi:hypothetical protein